MSALNLQRISSLSSLESQRQIMPQAALNFGQPRPTRRLGRSGRPAPARKRFRHRGVTRGTSWRRRWRWSWRP
eukprot:scaffold122834_cov75-Phaeocystis_antarctica.AAC.1